MDQIFFLVNGVLVTGTKIERNEAAGIDGETVARAERDFGPNPWYVKDAQMGGQKVSLLVITPAQVNAIGILKAKDRPFGYPKGTD